MNCVYCFLETMEAQLTPLAKLTPLFPTGATTALPGTHQKMASMSSPVTCLRKCTFLLSTFPGLLYSYILHSYTDMARLHPQ